MGRLFTRYLAEGLVEEAHLLYDNLRRMHISQYDFGKQIYGMFYKGIASVYLRGNASDIRIIHEVIEYWTQLHMPYRIVECCQVLEEVNQAIPTVDISFIEEVKPWK